MLGSFVGASIRIKNHVIPKESCVVPLKGL